MANLTPLPTGNPVKLDKAGNHKHWRQFRWWFHTVFEKMAQFGEGQINSQLETELIQKQQSAGFTVR